MYFVYILSSDANVLYVGVTNNLKRRIYEHRHGCTDGFTKKYRVCRLVYFELTDNIHVALTREKQLKHWKRSWKSELIHKANPHLLDLSATL